MILIMTNRWHDVTRAAQEQAHGGVRHAACRARRRRPPQLPPRDRCNNQPHAAGGLCS
jgi:hypothetical protein